MCNDNVQALDQEKTKLSKTIMAKSRVYTLTDDKIKSPSHSIRISLQLLKTNKIVINILLLGPVE